MPTMKDVFDAAALMKPFPHPWWIAGGFAMELFVGRSWREHGDLEIGLCRANQRALRDFLPDCTWKKALQIDGKGEWVEWEAGEMLTLPTFQLKAKRPGHDVDLEFFLDDAVNNVWRFRRNEVITRSLYDIIRYSPEGIPHLAPEVQLLYKAKHHRAKDESDFEAALPHLDRRQRFWLLRSLRAWNPTDPWLKRVLDAKV
jgi:hypothetical protein